MNSITPVILSGGSGTRLWPLSREAHPKQFLPVIGAHSLLQATALRLRGLSAQAPIVVANESHRFLVAEQLQAIGIPAGASTTAWVRSWPHRLLLMASKSINPVGARVLVMGLAFKENCPDVRNTHVVNILVSLSKVNAIVDVYDPWVDADEAVHELGIRPIAAPQPGTYDAIIIAVAHEQFKTLGAAGICAFGKSDSIIYDVKYVLRRDAVDGRL